MMPHFHYLEGWLACFLSVRGKRAASICRASGSLSLFTRRAGGRSKFLINQSLLVFMPRHKEESPLLIDLGPTRPSCQQCSYNDRVRSRSFSPTYRSRDINAGKVGLRPAHCQAEAACSSSSEQLTCSSLAAHLPPNSVALQFTPQQQPRLIVRLSRLG